MHGFHSHAWSHWEIPPEHYDRLGAPIGGTVRVSLFASGLPGFNALTALQDGEAWVRANLCWPLAVSVLWTDDPVQRAEQVNAFMRWWRWYMNPNRRSELQLTIEGLESIKETLNPHQAEALEVQLARLRTIAEEPSELLEYVAHNVSDLAKAWDIPVCYAHPQSEEAYQFLKRLGALDPLRQKHVINTSIACAYHGWIGLRIRQMCGERPHRGGRNFNIHPNNDAADMRAMVGVKPGDHLINGSGASVRLSLLRMVPGKFDDPEFLLGSTRSARFGPRMKEALPEQNQHWLLHLIISQKVGELLHQHLPRELMVQLCAEQNVPLGRKVPECSTRIVPADKPALDETTSAV